MNEGFVPNEIPTGKEYLFEGQPNAAAAARRGVARPADFPMESPEERTMRSQTALQMLRQTADHPETTPQEKAALEREIESTSRIDGVTAPAATQPPTWAEVLRMPEMKRLSSTDLEAARNQYFLDVVAPQVPTPQLQAARSAFDSDTKPGPIHRAVRAFSDAVRDLKASTIGDLVRQGVSKIDKGLTQPVPEVGVDPLYGHRIDYRPESAPYDRPFGERVQGYMKQGLDSAAADARARQDVEQRVDNSQPLRSPSGSSTVFGRELRRGVGGLKNTLDGWVLSELGGMIAAYRSVATKEGKTPQEVRLAGNHENSYDKTVLDYQKVRAQMEQRTRELDQLPRTAAVRKMFDGEGADGVDNFVNAFKEDPAGASAAVVGGSVPGSLAMLATAAIARFGGFNAATSAVAGGGASAATEFGNDYAQNAAQGMGHDEAWNRAAIKSGVVGLFDAVSMKSAGHALEEMTRATAVKDWLKESSKQAALGAGGETWGSIASGQMPQPGQVAAEAVGEFAMGAPEGVATMRSGARPQEAAKAQEPLALPPARVQMGAGAPGGVEAQQAAQQRADEANANAKAVYEGRDAEEARQTALKEQEAAAAAAPAEKPAGVKSMIAEPAVLFEEAKNGKGIFATIKKAMRDTSEYKGAQENTKFDLDSAVDALEADPNEIFRLAKAKPEVYATIARAAEQTQKLERAPTAAAAAQPAKGDTDAGAIRSDEGQVHAGRSVGEGGQEQGGQDLQRQAQARAAADNPELRRGGDGEAGNRSVDAAAHEAATSTKNALEQPSDAQREAGNYQKGHAKVAGLDVSIENPEGSKRRPEWPALKQHYGYIRGTLGVDKDHVDVYVKPGTKEDQAGETYVVNQNKADGTFDEHKVMLGYESADAARAAYLENYPQGFEKRIRSVVPMPMEKFKAWVFDKGNAGPKGGPAAAEKEQPAPAAKEPWQMKLDEYVASHKGQRVQKTGFQNRLGTLQTAHRHAVEGALQLGKPVPVEVRSEYPDLSKTYPDRRRDSERRKKVAEMAPEEMRKALLTDPLTGLSNRRAYDEVEKFPVQVAIDLDSLKWINDNMGHATGDELVKAIATALADETGNAYRFGGDEFVLQAETTEAANAVLEAVRARLAGAELVFRTRAGRNITKKGVDFSHGIGSTLQDADAALRAAKEDREAAGQRARRGEAPPGVAVERAEGEQASQGEAAAEKVGRKDSAAFKRGVAGKGMAIEAVKAEAGRLTRDWKNAPEIVVLNSPADAPFRGPVDAYGAFSNGKMYLFAGNLPGIEQLQYTVFHEILGHQGMREFFGNKLDPILQNIAVRNPRVRAAAAEWKSSNAKLATYTDAEYNALAIEEALADIAGSGRAISGLGKLLAAVQGWLRKHGFNKVADWLEQLDDLEALSVLAQARAYVAGEPGARRAGAQLAPAFHTPPGKSFADAVKDLVTGKSDRRDVLHVGETPPVLRLLGMKQNRIVLSGNTIDKMLYDHAVPMPMVQRLPALLADPVLVFESDTVPGDFVVVTTEKVQGKPLVVTMRPDGDINRELVNVITSAYPRNKPGEAFNRWVKGDLLAYQDETKRPGWQRSLGLQLPGKMPSRGAGKRLLTQQDLVNAAGGQTPGTKEGPVFARPSAPGAARAQKSFYTRTANAVIDRIDRVLDPILGLPDREAFLTLRYKAQGHVDRVSDIARSIYDVFAKASEADSKAAYDYLTTKGAKPDAIADKAVRDHAERTKDMIDQVGQALVKHGLLEQATFEENRGAYLPRIYLKHLLDAKDWARIGGGRKPGQMGYLRKRQDIPKEVREILLGEIKDPGYLASMGFTRAMRDIHLLEWLGAIAKNEQWVLPKSLVDFNGQKVTPHWLKAEATRLREQAEYQEPAIAKKARAAADAMDKAAAAALADIDYDENDWKKMPDTPRYGRLRGVVVRKEIYDDIVGIGAMVPPDAGWAEKLLGYGGIGTKATQLWKASKVSLNPPSQVRNAVSNAMLLHLSGVSMVKIPVRLAEAAKAIRTNGKAWQVAKKNGIKANTFSATELHRIETEMLDVKARQSRSALAHIASIAAKGFNAAGDVYQFMESLFKTAKIIDELANGMSEEQAVLEANKWLFDYSRVSPSVRYLRNAPIGAPFLTFMVKVGPRLIEVGLKHPQRYLPYIIAAYAIPYAVASMLGVGTDDLEKLKKLLPESWQTKGHVYVLPWKDEHGRWQVLDLSYFMPWAQYDQAARQLGQGDVVGTTKTLGVFGGPIPDIITAWKTNKDPFSGRDIVSKGAPPALQLGALLTYAMNLALPPWLTGNGIIGVDLGDPSGVMSGKLARAVEGKTNKYGDPVTTGTQAALSMVGVNMRSVDPQTDRAALLNKAQRGIADTRMELKHQLEDRALSPIQREAVKGVYVDEMKRRSEKAKKLAEDTRLPPALQ